MKDTKKYSDKYKHNESFVEFLDESNEFPDWTIIGIFYSALHYMNLFLSTQYDIESSNINSHMKRNTIIKHKCSDNIAKQYNILCDLSRTARYQYIDMSKQLGYARSCYKRLKDCCKNETLARLK